MIFDTGQNLSTKQSLKLLTLPMVACSFLSLLYLALIFLLPANPKSLEFYRVSSSVYHIVFFFFALPSVLLWFVSFYGYDKLSEYSKSIAKTNEGKDYLTLARGCAWLAWSFPLIAIASLLLSQLPVHFSAWQEPTVIIINYLNVVLPLISFTIIGAATHGLANDIRYQLSFRASRYFVIFFASAGVIYSFLFLKHFETNNIASSSNPYYLPLWLAITTIAIPYLYIWYIGLISAYQFTQFKRQVKGLLYKQSLSYLAWGLLCIIASLIAGQYAIAIQPRSGFLRINYMLPVLTAFRLLSALGFGLLAIGANKLKKIEEV